MEDLGFCERKSICDSAKSLKKYGSTSKHIAKHQNFAKHVVTSTDTLQGIALKYGVTMEQIRRSNRLWASDSIFLREYLLIPLAEENTTFPVHMEVPSSSNSNSEVTSPSNSIEDCENISNFLDKIDSSIASTKKDVRKCRGNSEFLPPHNRDVENDRRKPAVSRMKQFVNNNSLTNTVATPQARVVLSGNKLMSSLQKLEEQQDEIFEL